MAGVAPKKYGLIVPPKRKKQAPVSTIKKHSVFGDSSSDEETSNTAGGKAANKSLWRENKRNAMQMESHQSVLKALKDDPSVFEYDSVYDEMQERKKKLDPRLAKKDKSSKYIEKLKKVAERRKVEQDIIYERKVQREMEREGKEYGDKDTFLTSAYRKALEERKILEEELKMEAKIEEAQDVKKQVDISRFHRTLLNRITDPDAKSSSKKEARERAVERPTSSGEVRDTEEEGRRSDGEGGKKQEQSLEHSRDKETLARGERAESESNSSSAEEPERSPDNTRVSPSEETPAADTETGSVETQTPSLFPPTVDKEAKRRVAAAKRANEETLSSAKERYLARKRAKLTAPVISEDD